jgi:hypothetical protein
MEKEEEVDLDVGQGCNNAYNLSVQLFDICLLHEQKKKCR